MDKVGGKFATDTEPSPVSQTYYIGELLEKVQEPIESDHEFMWIEYEHLKGKMFTEMQNWAIEHAKNFLK